MACLSPLSAWGYADLKKEQPDVGNNEDLHLHQNTHCAASPPAQCSPASITEAFAAFQNSTLQVDIKAPVWNAKPGCFWETSSGWWWRCESPFVQRAAPSQCMQYRPDTPSHHHHHHHHPLPVSVSLPLCSPNSASRITRNGIAVMATGASLGASLCSLYTVGYNLPLSWTHSCQCPNPGGCSSFTNKLTKCQDRK